MLTSLNNPSIKHLVRMRDNRARRRAGRVIVDGWRETQQALDAGLVLRGLYTNVDEVPTKIGDHCDADQIHRVSDVVMSKIAYGQSSRGVVAEFKTPQWGIDELRLPNDGLVLVLDRFEKPGNVGAAFRCADAAGVDAVLMTDAIADRFNPNAIRSSLGAVFRVKSAATSEATAREFLSNCGYQAVVARVESSTAMWNTDLTGPVAIVIGSEADGLGDRWRDQSACQIRAVNIPMHGAVDSLNASVSASILMYEARRQRSGHTDVDNS